MIKNIVIIFLTVLLIFFTTVFAYSIYDLNLINNNTSNANTQNLQTNSSNIKTPIIYRDISITSIDQLNKYFVVNIERETGIRSGSLPESITINPRPGVEVLRFNYTLHISGTYKRWCLGYSGSLYDSCNRLNLPFSQTYSLNNVGTRTFSNELVSFREWISYSSNESINAVVRVVVE